MASAVDQPNLNRKAAVSLNGTPDLPNTATFAICRARRLSIYTNTEFRMEDYQKLPDMDKILRGSVGPID